MNKNTVLLVAGVLGLVASMVASAATDWSAQDYDLYPGDFDGDGKTDLLYVAKDAARASGIARSDGNGPNIPFQSWPSNYLGIPWYGNQYTVIVADFNGDLKADLLLQRATAGDSYLLFADANGKITSVNQTISNTALSLNWSADQHRILAGDFNNDSKADLFFQATAATATSGTAATNAVVLANASGLFTTGPAQTWTDATWSAFKWSTQNSNIFVGDFNGDGKKDLLVQARPRIVLIDYDVPIPVPTYPPNIYGVALSQGGATPFQQVGVQQWSRTANGVDWSPRSATVIVGDFDGNGRSDVLLQALNTGRPSYLLSGNAAGAVFTSGTALATNVTWAGDSFRLLAANFDGSGAVGIYFQAVSSAGTNYYASTITGGTVTVASDVGLHPVAAIGRTAGMPSVSQTGSAQYDIPIWTPPGAGGMRPELAISYNHARENGILGMGFALSGFSAIARCRKTIVHDGADGAIEFTANDSLCIDGMKLRVESGAPVGKTYYRTETESFARIIATVPGGGTGPDWFEVWHRNGLIFEYGHSASSKIEAFGSSVIREWALSSIRDRAGNVIEFNYIEDTANGSYRPDEINYAKHASSPVISTAPYQVKFVYEGTTRADPIYQQYAPVGAQQLQIGPVNELKRLARIEVKYNNSTKRLYSLSYELGTTGRSRLKSVQECATSTDNCLAPTQFTWTGGASSFQSAQTVAATNYPLHLIDVDGDARDDLVYVSTTSAGGTWRIRKANASGGFDPEISTGLANTSYESAQPLEWDGDGRIDLIVPYSGNHWWVFRSNGAGFDAPLDTGVVATGGADFTRTVDINGDGRHDLLRVSSSGEAKVFVRYQVGGSFGSETLLWQSGDPNWQFFTLVGSPLDVLTYRYVSSERRADFNGDGREDFLAYLTYYDPESQTATFWVSRFYDGVPGVALDAGPDIGGSYEIGDFNDDQLTDVMWIKQDVNHSSRILYGGTNTPINGPNIAGYFGGPYVVNDFDGDGRDDVLMQKISDNVVYYWRSLGIGMSASPTATSLTLPSGFQSLRTADLTGDGNFDVLNLSTSSSYYLHNQVKQDLLNSAVDGYGVAATFTYTPMADPSVYTKGTGAPASEIDVTLPVWLAKQATLTDGTGAGTTFNLNFTYQGARRHTTGRGFLGFGKRTVVDTRPDYDLTTEETYLQTWPHTGLPSVVTLKKSNGDVLRQTTNLWHKLEYGSGTGLRAYPYIYSSTTTLKEISPNTHYATVQTLLPGTLGASGIDSTSGLTVDATTTTTEVATGLNATKRKFERVQHSSLTNHVANWCLGRPGATLLTNSHELTGGTSDTRSTTTTWDVVGCRPTQQVVDPSGLPLTTDFTYDGFGNVNEVKQTATSIGERKTQFDYSTEGVFAETITNALVQLTTQDFAYDLGVLKKVTDPNGLATQIDSDAFGRAVRLTRPDQTKSLRTYLPCSGCDPRVKYLVTEQSQTTSGAAIQTNQFHYDRFDRVLFGYQQMPNGSYSITKQDFDACGRVLRRYNPHWSTSEGYWQFAYDQLDRVTSGKLYTASSVLNREVSRAHNGLTTTMTDAEVHVRSQIATAWGDLARVTDAVSGNTNYQFDAFGLLTQTSDPAGNVTSTMSYNDRGMKTGMTDADLGAWTFEYNAAGETTKVRDPDTAAPAFTTVMTYDALGRMATRQDVPESVTSTFAFGTTSTSTSKTIGRLTGITTSNNSHTEVLSYDGYGRLSADEITTDESPTTTYRYDYQYDDQTGLPSALTYPVSTVSPSAYRFKINYSYAYGQVARVQRADSPYTDYWKFSAVDARGNFSGEDLGNGLKVTSGFDPLTGLLGSRSSGPGGGTGIQNLAYQWSLSGKLTERKDVRQGNLTETFTYDSLDRLDVVKLNTVTKMDVDYSNIGNITKKSDVSASTWTYDTVKKHALRTAGTGNTYGYDPDDLPVPPVDGDPNNADNTDDGNMRRRDSSDITWFSHNYPNAINGSGGVSSTFAYDPLRQRVKQTAVYTSGTETTRYIGGLLEKVCTGATCNSTNTQYRHYIPTPNGLVGLYTRRTSGTLEDTFYFTKDHLGSIDSITNASAAVQVRLSYDAFGKRRNEAGWSGGVPAVDMTAIANTTRRGYTGHEHLDNLGLIHMNGRVQDPTIGRFLSADPFVPDPFSGQSFNRYSYVLNNPMSLIDPSGFDDQDPDGNPIDNLFNQILWRLMSDFSSEFNTWQPRLSASSAPLGAEASVRPDQLQARSNSTTGGNESLLPGLAPLNVPTNLGSAGNIPLLIKGADAAVEIGSKATKWRRIGLRGEELARSLLLASGYEILAEQLYVRTSTGLRITDFVVTGGKCGVDICGFEVKANTATRSNLQVVKDGLIATQGGTVASWFQPAFTYGEPVRYETYLIGVTITPAPIPK